MVLLLTNHSEKSAFLASTGAKISGSNHGSTSSREDGVANANPTHELDVDGKVIVSSDLGTDVLLNSWTVWFMHRGPGVKISNYLLATKQVGSFSTVQEFWKVYSHLKRVDRLPFTSEFQVFRKGVKPMWEDPVNVNGGKWVVRFRRPFKSPQSVSQVVNSPMGEFGLKEEEVDPELSKLALLNGKTVSNQARSQARLYWEKLLLAITGGSLAADSGVGNDEIIGMVMSVRRDEDILSIWTRSPGENGEGNTNMRDAIRTLLELPESVQFSFKVHTESIKEGEQKQALYNNNVVSSASLPGSNGNRAFESDNTNNNHQNHNNTHHSNNHNSQSNGYHYNNNNNSNNHHNNNFNTNNNNGHSQSNASPGFSRRNHHFTHSGTTKSNNIKTVDSPVW